MAAPRRVSPRTPRPAPPGASDTLSVWPPDHGFTPIPFNLSIRETADLRYIEQGGVPTTAAQQILEDVGVRKERLGLKNLKLYNRTLVSDPGIVCKFPSRIVRHDKKFPATHCPKHIVYLFHKHFSLASTCSKVF